MDVTVIIIKMGFLLRINVALLLKNKIKQKQQLTPFSELLYRCQVNWGFILVLLPAVILSVLQPYSTRLTSFYEICCVVID